MFLIIDGSSLLSTNYFGTLPLSVTMAKTDEEKTKHYNEIMQTSDGKYTNGVFSSLRTILTIIRDQKPEGVLVCLDASRDTFRREIYSEYKAQRTAVQSPLAEQFKTFNSVLSQIGIPTFFSPKYEADDLAGSLAAKIEKFGGSCVVLSGDKDYYQLVSDKTNFWRIVTTPAQPKYEKLYGIKFGEYSKDNNLPANIFEITQSTGLIADKEVVHLTPEQFIDYLAVVGDKVDNIPGVPSVGPSTIIPMLEKYGSLDGIYRTINEAILNHSEKELALEIKSLGIRKNPIQTLIDNKDKADLSKQLATIDCSVPMPGDLESYKLNINQSALEEVIKRYEFKSLQPFIEHSDEEMEREP